MKWTQAACTSTTPISQAYEGECAGISLPNTTYFCTIFLSQNVLLNQTWHIFAHFFSLQNVRLNSLSLELPVPYLKLLNVLMERSAAVDNATLSGEIPRRTFLILTVYLSMLSQCGKCHPKKRVIQSSYLYYHAFAFKPTLKRGEIYSNALTWCWQWTTETQHLNNI